MSSLGGSSVPSRARSAGSGKREIESVATRRAASRASFLTPRSEAAIRIAETEPARERRTVGVSPEILRQVKLIELRTRGLVNSVFAGEYHSVFKGQGMEFAEVREY